MDAARADVHKPKDASKDSDTSKQDTASTASTEARVPAAKASGKSNDDTAKKGDADKDKTDDTSIASTMLALIGVPPKVTDGAAKVLGVAKDALTGKLGDAIGSLLPGAGAAGDVAAGAKDGAASTLTGMSALAGAETTTGTGTAAPVSPFAALLVKQGADLATKDDASVTDPATATSPMPLMHAQGMAITDTSALQVQATQAATSPRFTQELGEQIAWMGSGDVKEARIKLHPEELGSMDVRVNMDGNKVNVAIIAQHPAAVHAVQQTLSQLDTLLAHHGLSLGQADVGQRGPGQGADGQGGSSSGQGSAGGDGSDAVGSVVATSPVSRGLVDEVA